MECGGPISAGESALRVRYPLQPATLPPVPTNERLSLAVDQLAGSGHFHLDQVNGSWLS
jgi:hypothetical protein